MSTPNQPDNDEINIALQTAEMLRDTNHDYQHVGHALIYFHERMHYLDEVYRAAKRYLHSGSAQHEHARLTLAIKHAEQFDRDAQQRGSHKFGLD